MHVHARSLPGLAAGAVLLLAALPLPAAHADATRGGSYVRLILNDGFVIQGMVRREGNYEIEQQAVIFMPTGFFFLDDTARRQYFSTSLAQQNPQEIKPPSDDLYIVPKNHDIRVPGEMAPSLDEVLNAGPWDDDWNRTFKFRSGLKAYTVRQRLTALTPYYTRIDATERWLWHPHYLTSELGPDVVRKLLSSHPDFAEDPKISREAQADRRFRYCDFMAQAGFYDEAEAELGRLVDDQPTEAVKAKVEAVRSTLRQWESRDRWETINRMHNAGQFQKVAKMLAEFDDKDAEPQTLIHVNELRDKYKAADLATADAVRFLDGLAKQPTVNATLADAAAALRADLQPEILPRLDAFLGQARQAERESADGKTPTVGPSQLLALAVTGWLGALPDPTPERAVQLWQARKFVLKYLGANAAGRKAMLGADPDGPAPLDDVTRLIPLLPPPEPEQKITEDVVETTLGKGANAVKYLLQLPPEYRHSRSYPVLIVLHQGGEEPKDMIERWRDAAALNGYILVAPEWSQNLATVYGYSDQEHAVVLDTLRDLRRRFAVDSDRVFLFGLGQGGLMAFDVGLSHPDLFAGVLPMSAGVGHIPRRYFRNAEYLPFYIVEGDHSGKAVNDGLRDQFEDWVSQYPMMWIQYKGRGLEWFGGEAPTMFDWMHGKKRGFPLQELGGPSADGRFFTTHRVTDDRFYWLTTDNVQARCLNSETNWNGGVTPAKLQGRIDVENNAVLLDTSGLAQVTVWLAANNDSVGGDMVQFDKPLTVRWNGNTVWKSKPVAPSLGTLLEDLADRGDRQRLFTAKLEFSSK